MTTLVLLEEHENFRDASSQAREVAQEFDTGTSVCRSGSLWQVLVPPFVASHLVVIGEPSPLDEKDEYGDEYLREIVQPLLSEFYDYEDSYARSEEDGWYYEK